MPNSGPVPLVRIMNVMSRWPKYLVLLCLALATPLMSGCLTTLAVHGAEYVLTHAGQHKSKDNADRSHARNDDPNQPASSDPQRHDEPNQPAGTW